jgi:hypothetical protein
MLSAESCRITCEATCGLSVTRLSSNSFSMTVMISEELLSSVGPSMSESSSSSGGSLIGVGLIRFVASVGAFDVLARKGVGLVFELPFAKEGGRGGRL